MPDQVDRLSSALSGRYTIERELGRGGMAVVYLARDLKHDRLVAVKLLNPDLAASLGSERFLREIQITARLTHPHVLMLIDSGEANGLLYYVMPFVEGESLRDRLDREKQLSVDDALQITREVADALSYSHGHGVIHRDIKPENILLESGHAVVSDFGVARALSAASGEQLTATGLAVGTPAYMSPEQAGGETDLDARTDVYSLGCVLYEMLSGDPPFTGSTAQAILARKASETVPALKTVRDTVPDAVDAALQKALARVPADRYATVQAFSEALRTTTESPKRRFVIPAAVVAAFMLAVIAFVALGGRLAWLVRPAAASFFNAQDRVLVSDFVNETDQQALALAIRQAIETDLDQSGYANVVDRTELSDVLQRMRLEDSSRIDVAIAQEIAQRQGYRAVVSGGVGRLGAGYQLTAQIIEPATGEVAVRLRETAANESEVLDAVERLTRLARRHLGESLRSLARSQPLPQVTTRSVEALRLLARAGAAGRQGEYPQAIALLRQAVEVDTAFATAYRALSIYYGNMGNESEAQINIDRAHRHNDRLTPRERYLIGSAYHSRRGRLDSAAHYYALQVDRWPNDPTALNNLGDVYERMGRYDEALAWYQRAADAGRGIVPLLNVASAARTLGRHSMADSTLALMVERFPSAWMTWQTSAGNALYAGNYDTLWTIATDMANSQHAFPRSYGRWLLASLSAMRGQISAAVALVDTATVLAREAGSQVFEYTPLLLAQYAALAAGSPERAIPLLEKARDPAVIETSPSFRYLLFAMIAHGHALAGDWESTNQLLASLDSLANAEDFHATGVGNHVRALLALVAGRPEESLDYLNRARRANYGLQHHSGRLLRGDTYAALDRWSEAAAQYDTVSRTFGLNFNEMGLYGPLRPLAHERAATAYLALGDTAAAIQHLATFAELWEEADPDLQPVVSQVKARLATLVGEPGATR